MKTKNFLVCKPKQYEPLSLIAIYDINPITKIPPSYLKHRYLLILQNLLSNILSKLILLLTHLFYICNC